MAITKEDILEAVADMSVMDVCELVEMMEEKFGVSAQAAVAVAAPAAVIPVPPSAREACTVNLSISGTVNIS